MKRFRTIALGIGALATIVCILGAVLGAGTFIRSYLVAYLFWLGLTLGGFGLIMLHHLVGGCWGYATRRFYEAGLTTLPLVALLAIPLCFGVHEIYGWAMPSQVAVEPVLQHRHAYLNLPFFIVRMIVYFTAWIWLARVLLNYSRAQDITSDLTPTRRLRMLSGPGLILYVLSATFAYVDFILALEPDWYSTVYLILIIVGHTLAVLSLGIILLRVFSKAESFALMLTPKHFHDLGNLLLAFVMLWAYIAFSQILIIWSGNLPDEISWYLHRSSPGWKAVALILGLFHFAIPLALLLSRGLKFQISLLCAVAALVLVTHAVDVYWLVVPSFQAHGLSHSVPLEFTAFLAIGGFWSATFITNLLRHSLVPRNAEIETRLEGARAT